jgi:RHS repeat-associated protein
MNQFFTYKFRFLFLVLHLVGLSALAQKPTASKNYMMVKTYKVKSQDETLSDPKKVDIGISYMDGMGRSSQSIAIHASPTGKDLVKPHIYDSLGREAYNMLPFSYTPTQNNNGAFINNAAGVLIDGLGKKTATGAISNFYNTSSTTVDYTKDTKPFSETQFEASGYSRVLKQESVGKNFEQQWANVQYRFNDFTVDAVRRFKYTGKYADADELVDLYKIEYDSTYKANSLTAVRTTDADGKSSVEFTDQEGRTVLKRSLMTNGQLDTYYVYDDYGQVRAVLPPKLAKRFTSTNASGLIQIDSLKRYAYLNMYDDLGRQTVSKKPEIEPVYSVYDNWDRVVFTQDGNQRTRLNASNVLTPVWAFAKYDLINRPAMTGEVPYSGSRLTLQTNVNAVTLPTKRYETISNSIYYSFNNSSPAGITIDSTQILTVNYYDGVNYTVPAACPSGTTTFTASTAYNYDASHVVNMATGSRTRVLGTTNWTRSVVFYDYDYRPIQTISDIYGIANSPGATEVSTAEYNWIGEVLTAEVEHKAITTNSPVRKVTKSFVYDHNHRLQKTKYRLGNLVSSAWVYSSWMTLSTYDYNELGQLKTEKLHEKPVQNTYGQSVAYLYNIQGSTTEINAGTSTFYEKIFYEKRKDLTAGLYNGSIAEMYWKNGTKAEAGFKFTYDEINRLTSTKGVAFTYEERGIKYDDNSNITQLSRLWNNVLVDSLRYTYRGNQLANVVDLTTSTVGFKNGTTISAGIKYTYDANGNMLKDGSKGIGINVSNPDIKYNLLDLVQEVFVNAKTVKYTYDATGEKLIRDVGTTEKNTYAGIFEYDKNGVVTRIETPHGQIVKDATTSRMHYQYYLQDHLGNVRVMVDSIGAIQQQTDYLAFGSVINYNNLTKNKYLYQGKEYQSDANWLDFGARMYDPTIGRWFSPDPMSQMVSPYDYNGGDPINRIDPDGRSWNTITGALVGFGVGVAGYGLTQWATGGKFDLGAALGFGALGGIAGGLWGGHVKFQSDLNRPFFQGTTSSGSAKALSNSKGIGDWAINGLKEVAPKIPAIANQLVASNSQNKPSGNNPPSFKPFYKQDLLEYAKENGRCNPCTDQQLGYVFEDIFEETIKLDPAAAEFNFRKGSKLYGDVKNTKTDFEMDADFVPRSYNPIEILFGTKRIKGGISFELKAKDGTLILSQNEYQLRNHIDNLFNKHSGNIAKYGKEGFRPWFNVITIANTELSNGILAHAAGKVHFNWSKAYFYKKGTRWNFIFK